VVEWTGFENRLQHSTNTDNSKTYESDDEKLSRFLALLTKESPDLADVVKAWPAVPAALKSGILAMIRNVSQGPACK